MEENDIPIAVNINGIKMKTPIMTASGTFGYGSEYTDFVDLNQLGAIVVKGITNVPWTGNEMPRIAETPQGMLNSIGLQNVGVERFIDEKLPYLMSFDVPVIVNVCGKMEEEYVEVVEKLSEAGNIASIELNISCPNLNCGGMSFGVDPNLTYQLVQRVREKTDLPLLVKLSPNVTDVTEIAVAAEDAGADGLSAINTLLGMGIDIETRKPLIANVVAGLSGPAIKPIALRVVWQVYNTVKIPIIGMGGIMKAEDAIEFFVAGASAIAVGTANFVNPSVSIDIVSGIREYLNRHQIGSLQKLVGSLEVVA